MVAALLGETPSRAAQRPGDQRRGRSSRGLLEVHGVDGRRGPGDGRAAPRPERRRDAPTSPRSTRTPAQPHPDPVLRAAAAPPRRGVHPRPRRLPHRRPPDQLPPRRAARVRRGRRQAPRAASASPPRTACTAPSIELPYPSVGATEQVLLTAVRAEGVTELQERRHRARDHGPHRDPAEDGRDHHRRDRPRHPHRGRRRARAATTHRALSDRNEAASLGLRRAGHRRRHLRRRRQAAGPDDVPQRLPQGRRRVRHRRRRHPVLAPGRRRSSRSCSRPTCTPAS